MYDRSFPIRPLRRQVTKPYNIYTTKAFPGAAKLGHIANIVTLPPVCAENAEQFCYIAARRSGEEWHIYRIVADSTGKWNFDTAVIAPPGITEGVIREMFYRWSLAARHAAQHDGENVQIEERASLITPTHHDGSSFRAYKKFREKLQTELQRTENSTKIEQQDLGVSVSLETDTAYIAELCPVAFA